MASGQVSSCAVLDGAIEGARRDAVGQQRGGVFAHDAASLVFLKRDGRVFRRHGIEVLGQGGKMHQGVQQVAVEMAAENPVGIDRLAEGEPHQGGAGTAQGIPIKVGIGSLDDLKAVADGGV